MRHAADSILVEEVEVVAESPTNEPACARRLSASQRRARVAWLVALVGVYSISFAVPRSSLPHLPLCWWRALTGWSCPACGLTRAFTEIGHGNLAVATQLHLLSVPLFALGLGLVVALSVELCARRDWLVPLVVRWRKLLLALLAGGVLLRYLPLC